MKVEALLDFLEEHPDIEEILIEGADGYLHECRAEVQPEAFDGFETAYPESVKLIMID
jgi:hypothetical protein